jgi:hypothetical protein
MSITGFVPPVDVILFAVPETLATVPAVVAKVPLVGKVTFVVFVMVNVLANAPEVVRFPPRVRVDAPLLTPVPPRAGDNCPVHPKVMDVGFNKAVVGLPPKVIVTLVSFTALRACPLAWNNERSCALDSCLVIGPGS